MVHKSLANSRKRTHDTLYIFPAYHLVHRIRLGLVSDVLHLPEPDHTPTGWCVDRCRPEFRVQDLRVFFDAYLFRRSPLRYRGE